MKKILTNLLILTAFSSVCAQPVNRNSAEYAAKQYIYFNEPNHSQTGLTYYCTLSSSDGTPTMYVFNIGNDGFIITGNDRSHEAIIGYSFNGAFDSIALPNNLRWWLNGFSDDIVAVDALTSTPAELSKHTAKCSEEWDALLNADRSYYASKDGKGVNALLQTQWNQGGGYNNYCPVYSNGDHGHSVTGCVATAMAQIIRYHQYPNTGFSRKGYTHSYFGYLSAAFDSAYYDYSLMPNSVTPYSNASYQHAVSLLCYHCGVSVRMNYECPNNTDGSGAHSEDVPVALYHFGYTEAYYKAKSPNTAEWDSLLRHDLDLGRPVYYSGRNSDGGHAFVCDGYNNSNKYHFNFGWGGYGDGYYSLSSVNGYSNGQAAVFNIVPSNIGPIHDTVYVAADGTGDGSSWNSATPNLHSAMAIRGLYKSGEIWVKSGVSYGDTHASAAFTMPTGVKILGGFSGGEQSIGERQTPKPQSIMSGRNKHIAFEALGGLQNAFIYDMTFADGLAATGAGAKINNGVRFERCTIQNNTVTTTTGAALYANNNIIYNCVINSNYGGGVTLNGSNIRNSLIAHNDGFGIQSLNGTMYGCDIVCNTGVGVINDNAESIRNCVFWRNDSSLTSNNISNIKFCAVQGFGEKDSNSNFGISYWNRPPDDKGPLFMNPDTTIGPSSELGDWHLSSRSPLVDAGDTIRSGSYTVDLDNNNRFRNGRVDIGCYEHDPYVPITQPSETASIQIYPNPANNSICIENANGNVDILDIMGRPLISATATEDRTILDISNLPNGIYILRTNGATAKFIKK